MASLDVGYSFGKRKVSDREADRVRLAAERLGTWMDTTGMVGEKDWSQAIAEVIETELATIAENIHDGGADYYTDTAELMGGDATVFFAKLEHAGIAHITGTAEVVVSIDGYNYTVSVKRGER